VVLEKVFPMKYVEKSFTLPTTSKRMTQTEYEIAVGLRHPDGRLVQPKRSKREEIDLNDEHDFWDGQ
jgi:hypothetical protein